MMKHAIYMAVAEALEGLGAQGSFSVDYPKEMSHGDYATNAALIAAKETGKNPREVAEFLRAILEKKKIKGVAAIEIAGPGFINFRLSDDFFSRATKDILAKDTRWGRGDSWKGVRVAVEYGQPNPFKPFHIGHLMGCAIGEALARLVAASGGKVRRMNYQGDIGPHVAKAIWALRRDNLPADDVAVIGRAYVAGNTAYEEDPKAKAEIDEINKRLYANDPELHPLYSAGRKASLARFEEIYAVLGTKYDDYFFESQTAPLGKKLVEAHVGSIFEQSDGALVYRGEKDGLHTRVFVTSQGTPTYEAKEIGLVELKRKKFSFDLNMTEVAVEQDGYFKVVEAAIAQLWPKLAGKYTHVVHGLMTLQGGKMSSRKGNVVTGEDLIEEMRGKAREKMGGRDLGGDTARVADAVAVAAIKYTILKQGSGKNIMFDPEKAFSLEGDSGPYLQYAHTRAVSVLKKAKQERVKGKVGRVGESAHFARILHRFPEIVERAAREREPHFVTTYLTELAGAFNSWYGQETIVDLKDTASSAKVALTDAFRITMRNGLSVLGMQAPERM